MTSQKKDYFYQNYLNERGYNKIFLTAKETLGKKCKVTFYVVSFFYIVEFFTMFEILKVPSREFVLNLLTECRDVNKIKFTIKENGLLDKTDFYSFVKSIIEKNYEELLAGAEEKNSNEECKNYLINIFLETVKKTKYKHNVYPMLEDIVGLDEAKKVIDDKIIKPILHREIYEKYGADLGGGILLFGLPGTGKTMFAKAVANEINGHFISVSASDVKSRYFGETENKIKEIFDEARKHKVSVIFFDEFEAIGVSRDKYGSEITAATVVPELLSQMQGFKEYDGILMIIAATNRPWDIDQALRRPGRFDSLIYVDLPNLECRRLMFKKNLANVNAPDYIYDFLATKTEKYNGADIKNIADKIIQFVIKNEIDGLVNYEVKLEDCHAILKQCNSSVLLRDYKRMQEFIKEIKKGV